MSGTAYIAFLGGVLGLVSLIGCVFTIVNVFLVRRNKIVSSLDRIAAALEALITDEPREQGE